MIAANHAVALDLGLAEPQKLPFCRYPTAAETHRHGVQVLPARLPLVDFIAAEPHRSRTHRAVALHSQATARVLEAARVTASAFARREPQCRHLEPSRDVPAALAGATHEDAFGRSSFGPWDMENLLFWFVRTLILTDPTSPRAAIATNEDALMQSLVIVDDASRAILGAAMNETLHAGTTALRTGDPFLDAVLATTAPVMDLLGAQDADAVAALSVAYPEFARALDRGEVGHHFMIARADALPTHDAFELVAATAEHYQSLGFRYVIVEATNQWTGAACEVLNGVRVHFAPFRARRCVAPTTTAPADAPSSPDGYLAAKDSGSMLYVLRLS